MILDLVITFYMEGQKHNPQKKKKKELISRDSLKKELSVLHKTVSRE